MGIILVGLLLWIAVLLVLGIILWAARDPASFATVIGIVVFVAIVGPSMHGLLLELQEKKRKQEEARLDTERKQLEDVQQDSRKKANALRLESLRIEQERIHAHLRKTGMDICELELITSRDRVKARQEIALVLNLLPTVQFPGVATTRLKQLDGEIGINGGSMLITIGRAVVEKGREPIMFSQLKQFKSAVIMNCGALTRTNQ